ncbi:hypothetical protein ACHAWF_005561 [Thalassiosira exigua]
MRNPRASHALTAVALVAPRMGATLAFVGCPCPRQCNRDGDVFEAARAVTPSPEPTDLEEAASVCLPENWRECRDWQEEAADVLREYGVASLVSESEGSGLIDAEICDDANLAVAARLRDMHKRIGRRGVDPTGVEEPYRFSEIVCRDDGGRRYDLPIAFLGDGAEGPMGTTSNVGSGRVGTPLKQNEEVAIQRLHDAIGEITNPVMDNLWKESEQPKSHAAAAGFLVNEPGSQSQNWHRDGPEEGFIDCFVPLIDLSESIGPTAIRPRTHTDEGSVDFGKDLDVTPLLKKGEILLFDYRTLHRGQGNKSESTTRTLAYIVYKNHKQGSGDVAGDIHNFPAALTLEYD